MPYLVQFISNDGLPERVVPATGLQRGPCPRPSGDIGSGGWATPVRRMDFYYPHDVLTQLIPALIAPATAKVNVPIPFTLVLTYVTERPAAFDHGHPAGATVACPKVSFFIGDVDPDQRVLDCHPGTSIAPGASARYELEITTDLAAECIAGLRMQYDELPEVAITAPLTVTDCGPAPPKDPATTG